MWCIAVIEQGTPPGNDLANAVLAAEVLMPAHRTIVEGKTVSLPLESGENPLIAASREDVSESWTDVGGPSAMPSL
jgi:hypothetical protein